MSVALKRLRKECQLIFEKYENYGIEVIECEKGKKYSLKINIENKTLNFILSYDYPFKEPVLYINGNLYRDLLMFNCSELRNYLTINNINCLCCKTLLCRNNWKPGIKLQHIIDEYLLTKKIINYTIKKKYIRAICYNFNIFAEEIIELILNKIKNDPLKLEN